HVPLPTLRRRPRERLRMTRGRCGSLLHIRMTFAFTTPRRFSRRTGESKMKTLNKLLAVVAVGTTLTAASAQSAKEVRGASPYVAVENEPAPKLIVDPPLPEGLAKGIVWIQYRVENLRIVPVFGQGATNVSPRVGHLHITVDDLPWWWADASDNNTVDIAGLPPGEHKVTIALVDANHNPFPGQVTAMTFTVPGSANKQAHRH